MGLLAGNARESINLAIYWNLTERRDLNPRPQMDSQIDLFVNNLSVERGLSVNTIAAYSSDLRHFQNYLRESGISLWREVSRGEHKRVYSTVGAFIFAAFACSQAGRFTDIFQVFGERRPDRGQSGLIGSFSQTGSTIAQGAYFRSNRVFAGAAGFGQTTWPEGQGHVRAALRLRPEGERAGRAAVAAGCPRARLSDSAGKGRKRAPCPDG